MAHGCQHWDLNPVSGKHTPHLAGRGPTGFWARPRIRGQLLTFLPTELSQWPNAHISDIDGPIVWKTLWRCPNKITLSGSSPDFDEARRSWTFALADRTAVSCRTRREAASPDMRIAGHIRLVRETPAHDLCPCQHHQIQPRFFLITGLWPSHNVQFQTWPTRGRMCLFWWNIAPVKLYSFHPL